MPLVLRKLLQFVKFRLILYSSSMCIHPLHGREVDNDDTAKNKQSSINRKYITFIIQWKNTLFDNFKHFIQFIHFFINVFLNIILIQFAEKVTPDRANCLSCVRGLRIKHAYLSDVFAKWAHCKSYVLCVYVCTCVYPITIVCSVYIYINLLTMCNTRLNKAFVFIRLHSWMYIRYSFWESGLIRFVCAAHFECILAFCLNT